MNPELPTELWTRPTVISSVAPYQMSGLIANGLKVALSDRFDSKKASRSSRLFGSVTWSVPSGPAVDDDTASGSVSDCAAAGNADRVAPTTTHTNVDVLLSITVQWNIAHIYS